MTPLNLITETKISKELEFHLNEGLSLTENVYRPYSENFFNLINEVRNLYNKLLTGERLTEDQRKDFVSSGINLFKANTRSIDTFREGFVKTFKNKNINPSDIFMDSDFRPDKISVNGQEIDLPRGTILDNFDISTGEYIYLLPTGQRFKLKR